MGMDNFAYLNIFILFLFCNESEKKNYGGRTLTAEPPSSPDKSQCAFSWTIPPPSPPPSVRTLWITPFMGKLYLTDTLFLHYYFLDFFSRLPVYWMHLLQRWINDVSMLNLTVVDLGVGCDRGDKSPPPIPPHLEWWIEKNRALFSGRNLFVWSIF